MCKEQFLSNDIKKNLLFESIASTCIYLLTLVLLFISLYKIKISPIVRGLFLLLVIFLILSESIYISLKDADSPAFTSVWKTQTTPATIIGLLTLFFIIMTAVKLKPIYLIALPTAALPVDIATNFFSWLYSKDIDISIVPKDLKPKKMAAIIREAYPEKEKYIAYNLAETRKKDV